MLTRFPDIVPIVMAGIIGIYGLVVSVLVANDLTQKLPLYTGFIQLGAGLSVGLAGLAAGFAIGIVGDAGVRGTAQQPRLYVGMILILIFAEVLGKLWLLTIPICIIASNHLPPRRSVWVDCCSSHELSLEGSLLNERSPAACRVRDLESPMERTRFLVHFRMCILNISPTQTNVLLRPGKLT